MSNNALPPNDQEMTLVQHLLDFKTALTRAIIAIVVLFICLFPFANDIYTYIAEPLTRYLPEGSSMIATAVASPFLTPFKLAFILAIYLAMPYLLYQIWRFIAPALYSHEKQLVAPILFFSSFLFYAGGVFAYYVVFPLVFGFLSQSAPEGVTIATDITLYLDFVIKMFFAFGMAFEVPIVTVLLIITGMASPQKLSHSRPYIVVGAFVIGMLLTPPDIISQTMLAVPMWLLFEVGLLVGAYVIKRRKLNNETDPTDPTTNRQADEDDNSQPEYDYDDRYADQVDDDFDWDAEFDNIDSEMSILEKEYQKGQTAKKAGNQDDESDKKDSEQPSDSADNQATESTSDSNTEATDSPTTESKKPKDSK
jgi:sec-independent protein translocase protein TatC